MKKQYALMFGIIFMIFLVGAVYAETLETVTINGEQVNFTQYNSYERFLMSIGGTGLEDFSIMGDARNCGTNKQPNYDTGVKKGSLSVDCSDAGCDYCLIDVYNVDSSGNWLSNKLEYSDSISVLGSSSSYYSAEVYCCPEDWCSDDSDCNLKSGGVCEWMNTKDPRIGSDYLNKKGHWTYCSYPSQTKATCYILQNNQCTATTQWYAPCPTSTSGLPVYTSLSECQNHINTCSSPSNWVSKSTECCGNKPVACQDKRCVGTVAECGTCGCGTSCTKDSDCCQTQCGMNDFMQQKCVSGTCTIQCKSGYTKCPGDSRCVANVNTDCGSSGSKAVGASCESNIECDSGFCDVSGWFNSVLNLVVNKKTCQPTPWYLAKKVAIPRENIGTLTTTDQLSIACMSNDQCIAPDNYSATCIPLAQLKSDGTIPNTAGFFQTAKDTLNKATNGVLIGGAIGAALCVGGATATVLLAPTVAGSVIVGTATASACSALITGGAIIGGIKSTTVNEKDPLVKALKASDENSVGLCVADASGNQFYCKYTSWAAFFKITGNKCNDGLIIIIFALLALAMMFKR